ncbi:protein HEATR9 isoform X1 [Trichosurus vulpecula]|uniref:protein HEATR9 isoform X1 n=1 Tax=Trichosurus vulpecula TaxID=9337 RepID=UPI00186B1AD3|nr:protein HEATR9 isoform X1 [Trichosurus vulpecula]
MASETGDAYHSKTHTEKLPRLSVSIPELTWQSQEDAEKSKAQHKVTDYSHRIPSCHQVVLATFPRSPFIWRKSTPRNPKNSSYVMRYPDICLAPELKIPRKDWESCNIRKQRVRFSTEKPLTSVDRLIDPMKWRRLKDLTHSLSSPVEAEQVYAAQALGKLRVSKKFIIEALWVSAQVGPERVRYESSRTLALLGCLHKHVVLSLIEQLKGCNLSRRMDTLLGLHMALSGWITIAKNKREPIGAKSLLTKVLKLLVKGKSPEDNVALEAALCLSFLDSENPIAREFLLQCLTQGEMKRKMKFCSTSREGSLSTGKSTLDLDSDKPALNPSSDIYFPVEPWALIVLVKLMDVHTLPVLKAVMEQILKSCVAKHRIEAIRLLKIIGLKKIQNLGMENDIFELLRLKVHDDPLQEVREAVAEMVELLKMKPMMLNIVESQLNDASALVRHEAVISISVLGISSSRMFYFLMDMLDLETSLMVRKQLEKIFITLFKKDPWVRAKLRDWKLLVEEESRQERERIQALKLQKMKRDLESQRKSLLGGLGPLVPRKRVRPRKVMAEKGRSIFNVPIKGIALASHYPPCFKFLDKKDHSFPQGSKVSWDSPVIREHLKNLASQ